MSRRKSWGIAVAMLAAVAGGIAGGVSAIAAPAIFAPAGPAVAAPATQVEPAVDRTLAGADVATAPSATPVAEAAEKVAEATTTDAVPGAAPAAQSTPATPAAASAACPSNLTGPTSGAPGVVSAAGVAGTTTADLDAFAAAYNAKRVANCLAPVPLANFRYDACMEQRLFWMAEDPSGDTSSAWGHIGSVRSDGLPSVGCDGNLAGGMNNVGATFARKWWDSTGHRISLYNPDYTGSMSTVCIYLAVSHGGVPDEPAAFARAAARWGACT
ncbi:MAG: hypothetical protein ABI566_07560 [Pseudolysinimonas sp.]